MTIFDKKYQIFISSTYKDLIKAREEAIKVILNLYQIPIGMEMFSADNDEQWEVIKKTIEDSDYYLLIIGHRYGTLTKEKISYTEKEFDYAKSINIPVIAFIKSRDIATTPEERDVEYEKQEKLNSFLNKVQDNAMCDFWSTNNELGQKVAISLVKMFGKSPRIGWIKASNAITPQLSEELGFLSKENRELKEELLTIKSQINLSEPQFSVLINGNENLSLKIKKNISDRFDLIKEINDFRIDIKGKNSISEDYIKNYNSSIIDNKETAEKYNQEIIKYRRAQNDAIDLAITISNIGTTKANDIYIDIRFPDEIWITEESEIKKMDIPQRPDNIPMNPYEKNISDSLMHIKPNSFNSWKTLSTLPSLNVSKLIHPSNPNFSCRLQSNILTVKIHSLLHTRNRKIDEEEGFVMIPLKSGQFNIEATVICEELKEKISLTIPVNITEE